MKEKSDIELLIVKVVSDNAAPEEVEVLNKWIDSTVTNREIFLEYAKSWDLGKSILDGHSIEEALKKVKDTIRRKSTRDNMDEP